jgi:hypothetical protein
MYHCVNILGHCVCGPSDHKTFDKKNMRDPKIREMKKSLSY